MTEFKVNYPEQPEGDVKLRDRFGAVWSKGRDTFEGYWVYEADFRGWKELVTEFGPLVEYVEPPKVGDIRGHRFNDGGFIHNHKYYIVWTGEKWIELRYNAHRHELELYPSAITDADVKNIFTK